MSAKQFINPKWFGRWSCGLHSRLPQFYRKRKMVLELTRKTGQVTPVHFDAQPGVWKKGPHSNLLPVQNYPVPVIYPEECNTGLWGGEGIIRGYVKKRERGPRLPRIWRPCLKNAILYSEILDQHLSVTVTERTLLLIDNAFGFDHYILLTSESDLNSHLGMKLKQQMLTTLICKTMYPNDPLKQEQIYTKYKHYVTMTLEEIEWLGLTEQEALSKQAALEAGLSKPRPLKEVFSTEFLRRLEINQLGNNNRPEQISDAKPQKEGWSLFGGR